MGLPNDLNGVSYDELLTSLRQDLALNASTDIQQSSVALGNLGSDVNSQLATYQTAAQVNTALGPYETTAAHSADLASYATIAAVALKFNRANIAYGDYTVYFPGTQGSNTATITPSLSGTIRACFAIAGSGAGISMSVSSSGSSFGVTGYYGPGALTGTYPFFWLALA